MLADFGDHVRIITADARELRIVSEKLFDARFVLRKSLNRWNVAFRNHTGSIPFAIAMMSHNQRRLLRAKKGNILCCNVACNGYIGRLKSQKLIETKMIIGLTIT